MSVNVTVPVTLVYASGGRRFYVPEKLRVEDRESRPEPYFLTCVWGTPSSRSDE